MSAIDDLGKAREAVYGGVWTWERHGDGWALYVNRGEPIDPDMPRGFCNAQHGLNILTVGSDGFDSRGEQLRAFVLAAAGKVPMLKAERDAERKAWARFCEAYSQQDDRGGFGSPEAAREYWAAKGALDGIGVDVDTLLGAT